MEEVETYFVNTIDLDYSKITIDKAEFLDLNADYSTVKFKDIHALMCNADYEGIEAENVNSAIISRDYTSLLFGTVGKNLELRPDYGSVHVKNLSKGFEFVDINSEHTGIKIGIEPSTNFNFYIDLQYAGFKRIDSKVELFKSIEKNSNKYYGRHIWQRKHYGKGYHQFIIWKCIILRKLIKS